MIFNWVEIKNFKSYGDYETRIDLNINESRLLIGENGAGKTTFVDAIIWALYGKSLSNIDDVINRKTKENCKVEVSFDISGINYSIIRYRRHTVHKNNILIFRGKENISPRTAGDAQALILDLIEINYNAMVSSIIFSSELYISFLRSNPSDRLKIFENILSLKEILEYHKGVKEMRKPIRSELDAFILEKNTLIHEMLYTNNAITEYKDKVKNTLLGYKKDQEELKAEAERIKNDVNTLGNISVEEELEKNKLFTERNESNKVIAIKINAERDKEKNLDTLVKVLYDLKNKLARVIEIDVPVEKNKNDEFERITAATALIDSQINTKIAELEDVDVIRNNLESFEKDLQERNDKVSELKAHAETCPTCGQQVEKELTLKLINAQQVAIDEITKTISVFIEKKETTLANNNIARKAIQELNSNKETLPEKSIYANTALDEMAVLINQLKSDIEVKKQEVIHADEINKSISETIDVISEDLDIELEKSIYDNDYLMSIKERADKYQERLGEIEGNIKVINAKATSSYDKSYIDEMRAKAKEADDDQRVIQKKIEEKTIEDNHYDILQQLFSNKSFGVKKYIIENMLHVFNEKVNFYLPFFFANEVIINFSKDLDEEIKLNGAVVPFSTFSSGEKTRLELAIAFSLFMVVKTFFSSSVNLLIFDEILDMNLDSDGVESVLNIINNLSEDNSIIVISHRDEYKENFSNQITLKKDANEFSRLSVS